MITLATLEQATEQQIFDQVAKHLLTQKKKAMDDNGTCCYRLDRLKCAAGCLISDEEYTPAFECGNWSTLIRTYSLTFKHYGLISELQYIHDSHTVENWKPMLYGLAEKYNLKTDVLHKEYE